MLFLITSSGNATISEELMSVKRNILEIPRKRQRMSLISEEGRSTTLSRSERSRSLWKRGRISDCRRLLCLLSEDPSISCTIWEGVERTMR